MKDELCITFLQWALPHLNMCWPGFRKVRGQVCKRISRRLRELELAGLEDYRAYLENNPPEWHILDAMCRITISRFYRNKGTYDSLQSEVLPELIKNARQQCEKNIYCWCIGSASGEEPYSLSLMWDFSGIDQQGIDLSIIATEVDQSMIDRAGKGCYPASSIRELSSAMTDDAFTREDDLFCLKEKYKKRVQFLLQDIRYAQPDYTFHLILCRNLVFTYFSPELQEKIARIITQRLKPGGVIVLGSHEQLPGSTPEMTQWDRERSIYYREV
jgi:chemotaxis protein methyltransferase CheR